MNDDWHEVAEPEGWLPRTGVDVVAVLVRVLPGYALGMDGIHGVAHWARVLENGQRLVATTGGDPRVVMLFALLHDCRRLDDGYDPDHGPRASRLAEILRGEVYELDDMAYGLLLVACSEHTRAGPTDEPTLGACYDADRLDLGRIGVTPHRDYLSTAAATAGGIRDWACQRGGDWHVPQWARRWCEPEDVDL